MIFRPHSIVPLSLALTVILLFSACGGRGPEKQYRQAVKWFEQDRPVKALEAFRTVLLDESLSSDRRAEVLNFTGLLELKMGRTDEAEAHFQEASSLDESWMDPYYNLGMIYLEEGRLDDAEEVLSEAGRVSSEDPRPLEWLGHLRMKKGMHVEARRAFYEALNRAPRSPRVLTALANVDRLEGNPQDAVTFLMQALELDSNYAPALYNLGMIHDQDFKEAEQAEAYYRDFIKVSGDAERIARVERRLKGGAAGESDLSQTEQAPGSQPPDPTPVSVDLDQRVADYLAKAKDLHQQGEIQKSLNLCLQAAYRSSSRPDLKEKSLRAAVEYCFDMARAHYELARFLEETGRSSQALQWYKQAVALDGKTKYLHLDLARVAIEVGEDDAALSSLQAAYRLDPNDAEVNWELAVLLDRLGLKGKAAEAYSEFLERFPEDPRRVKASSRLVEIKPVSSPNVSLRAGPSAESRTESDLPRNPQDAVQAYNRGSIYLSRGDVERAGFFFKRAIKLDPYFVSAYYNQGLVEQQNGQPPAAIEMFRAAIQLKPDWVDAYYNLALSLHQAGRDQEAVESLKTLTQIQTDYASAYFLAGVIFAQHPSQSNLARRYYTLFIQFADPEDPNIAVAQAWLNASR